LNYWIKLLITVLGSQFSKHSGRNPGRHFKSSHLSVTARTRHFKSKYPMYDSSCGLFGPYLYPLHYVPNMYRFLPETPQNYLTNFRPLTSDPLEEIDIPMPIPIDTRTGDARHLLGEAEHPLEKVVETPEAKRAQHMFIRPGFDNIPAYN